VRSDEPVTTGSTIVGGDRRAFKLRKFEKAFSDSWLAYGVEFPDLRSETVVVGVKTGPSPVLFQGSIHVSPNAKLTCVTKQTNTQTDIKHGTD
jgi:hypothetical protein